MDKLTKEINYAKIDIKLEQFTGEEVDAALKKLKTEKLLASMKFLHKYGRQRNLTTYFFDYATQSINKTQ